MLTRIREIVQQYFDNDYPARIGKEFLMWLKSPAHEKEKDRAMNELWNQLNIGADPTTEASFERLMIRVQASATAAIPPRRKLFSLRKLSRIAAILILPLLSAAITYLVMKSPESSVEDMNLVECIVPQGEIRTITLPDSSVVTINSGSILLYPGRFSGQREIYLNGEAYFTVTKNKDIPFIVKTTDMEVEVLGTVFNVSSYSDSDNSSTTLESGKVNVRVKNSGDMSYILQANEQLTYDRITGLTEKNTVNVGNAIAWISGNLVIRSLPIDEVAKLIERKYGVDVFLNSSNFKDELITMKITDNEDITEFMQILQLLVPQLKYRLQGNDLFIY